MVHIAVFFTGNGLAIELGRTEELARENLDRVLADLNLLPDEEIRTTALTEKEFCEMINCSLKDVTAFTNTTDALDWVVSQGSVQQVIKELDDAEDQCKTFLTRKGYVVYDSEEEAIEELSEEVHKEIGGPNAIHGTYASDTMDDISTFVKKHGWLHLHNIIEAAL